MRLDTPTPTPAAVVLMHARWARLAHDFVSLRVVRVGQGPAGTSTQLTPNTITDDTCVRDVGELLLRGHDETLAEADRYLCEGHTTRTGELVEVDDIDDTAALAYWAGVLDEASRQGHAPPAPPGFWASFLRWRTPLGLARFADSRMWRNSGSSPPVNSSSGDRRAKVETDVA